MAKDGRPVFISDLGKVLVNLDYSGFEQALYAGSSYTKADFRPRFTAMTEELYPLFETGKLSEDEFFNRFADVLKIRSIPRPHLVDIWNSIFTPIESMLSLIVKLKERECLTLVLLSNTNPPHFSYCRERFPQLGSFDRYILSYEEGIMKPALEIYRRAKALFPEDTDFYFLDDSAANIESAAETGIRGSVFTGYDSFIETVSGDPVFGPCFREVR